MIRVSVRLFMLLALAAPAGIALSASSASQPIGFSAGGSYLRAEDFRIAEASYRIALRGKPHCPATHPLTGLALHHLGEYAPGDQPEAAARFGLARGPGVLAVVPGSPAAQSGFVAGDVLLSVNALPFAAPGPIAAERNAKHRRKLIEESETQFEEQLRLGTANIGIVRAGHRLTLPLQPVLGCEVRARLARSSQASAFANGRYAIMTTRMLGFVRSED